jgi:hypothetical protein
MSRPCCHVLVHFFRCLSNVSMCSSMFPCPCPCPNPPLQAKFCNFCWINFHVQWFWYLFCNSFAGFY